MQGHDELPVEVLLSDSVVLGRDVDVDVVLHGARRTVPRVRDRQQHRLQQAVVNLLNVLNHDTCN